ncbi:uncharacterized protein LOC132757584 [Ruditapes philippinarum]|uniref:uncharacterized protein LOC132757584 n=1 Tax=Ruditapes philippinarum TaxID=129788 RepID=UPI00295AD0F9|nr:uncharacterized protein LOC132757584 [Ruditapes philippinarum]
MGEKCPSRKIPGPKRGILQEEITFDQSLSSENNPRQSEFSGIDCSIMANTGVVQSIITTDLCPVVHSTKTTNVNSAKKSTQATSCSEDATGSLCLIREQLQNRGLSEKTIEIILQSWKTSTTKQYGSYFRKWLLFSSSKQIDSLNPSTVTVLEFLTELYESGLGYSAINTAKSAISSTCKLINDKDIGNDILIKKFMRGLFSIRPTLPKYDNIWDVNKVLQYISSLPNNNELSLLQLSQKLSTLFMLLTGQRCQTIHLVKLSDLQICKEQVVCHVSELVKQSKPGLHVKPMQIRRYFNDPKLCLVNTLETYIIITSKLRGTELKLFISTVKPFKAVTKTTVARWIKQLMQQSGIDVNKFGVHSCRAASTSAAANRGVQIDSIMKAAGWSSAKTFALYYNKTVEQSFSDVILDGTNI